MAHHGEAFRETLVGLELQSVIVVTGVRAVVTEVLRPAEFLEEGLALIERQRAKSLYRRLVEVVVAAVAGEDVSAFRTDVSRLDRDVAGQLALHRDVPLVARRQAQRLGQNERRHAIRQDRAAVRPFRLAVEDRIRIEWLRPLREREDREVVLRGLSRLYRQH